MTRTISPRDALFVEGPDDGAVVNAFVRRFAGCELAGNTRLVKTREDGGGSKWAIREFAKYITEAPQDARIGLIIDRDGTEGRKDNWPVIQERLHAIGSSQGIPQPEGYIVRQRIGVWMWPDSVGLGDLEDFVVGMLPNSPLLRYADETTGIAKSTHGAEYAPENRRKASLKVRSIWRDARAAGGYGHLIRNLQLQETPASTAFLAWFRALFLSGD